MAKLPFITPEAAQAIIPEGDNIRHEIAQALLTARIEVESNLEAVRELVNKCLGTNEPMGTMNSVPALLLANRRLAANYAKLQALGELHEKVTTSPACKRCRGTGSIATDYDSDGPCPDCQKP